MSTTISLNEQEFFWREGKRETLFYYYSMFNHKKFWHTFFGFCFRRILWDLEVQRRRWSKNYSVLEYLLQFFSKILAVVYPSKNLSCNYPHFLIFTDLWHLFENKFLLTAPWGCAVTNRVVKLAGIFSRPEPDELACTFNQRQQNQISLIDRQRRQTYSYQRGKVWVWRG